MQAEEAREYSPVGGVSAFWLKIIAIVGMFLQHMALALPGAFPLGFEIFLQIAGGLTMPIMAFLLVEGFHATSNLKKYITRLAIFGGIAFLPHMFALGGGFNIMFTLLIGLYILYLRKVMGNTGKFWLAFIGLSLVSSMMDWGIIGPICIFLYDAIKNEKARRVVVPIVFAAGVTLMSVVMSAVFSPVMGGDVPEILSKLTSPASMFFPIGSLLAIPLLLMYKGERGRPAKWFFYTFYPAHLALLAIVSIVLGRNILITIIRIFINEFAQLF